jgi:hypothetical protein
MPRLAAPYHFAGCGVSPDANSHKKREFSLVLPAWVAQDAEGTIKRFSV